MITGRTFPILSWVRALNCLQNSMMLIPLEPSAGPIGGAGLAWPPFTCNLTKPVISFAISYIFLVITSHRPKADETPKPQKKSFLFRERKGRGNSFLKQARRASTNLAKIDYQILIFLYQSYIISEKKYNIFLI